MKRIVTSVLLAAMPAAALNAQVVVPGAAQPGRVQEQLQPRRAAPPAVDLTVPTETPTQQTPAEAQQVSFVLNSITVEGSTIYKPEDLKPLYQNLIGQRITLAQLYAVANTITAKYRADGYILSQVVVPQQNVQDGNVKLQALEGFINKVYIQPEKGYEDISNSSALKGMAKSVEGLRPLTIAALERSLLLMNDLPGMRVKGVVKASPDTPRAADLYLVVSRKRVDADLEINNRGSRYLGPGQAIGGIRINQITGERDALSLRAATTDQTREMQYGAIGYERTLTDDGLKMNLQGSTAITHPGAALEPFEVMGQNSLLSAQVAYPIIRSRSQNLSAYGQFDYNDVKTKILGTQLSKDEIRALRGGINWNNADSYLGANIANLQVSQGLDMFGASERGDPVSRPAFDPTFTKFNATLSREQGIPDTQFSVLGAVTGQFATGPLLAPEEFGLGGETFGGAYDPSEITGDSGAALRLEGRYTAFPGLPFLQTAQPYAFYDVGVVHNRDPGVGVNNEQTLASVGAGVRMYAQENISAAVEVADPISRAVNSFGNRESPRIFFKVRKAF